MFDLRGYGECLTDDGYSNYQSFLIQKIIVFQLFYHLVQKKCENEYIFTQFQNAKTSVFVNTLIFMKTMYFMFCISIRYKYHKKSGTNKEYYIHCYNIMYYLLFLKLISSIIEVSNHTSINFWLNCKSHLFI